MHGSLAKLRWIKNPWSHGIEVPCGSPDDGTKYGYGVQYRYGLRNIG